MLISEISIYFITLFLPKRNEWVSQQNEHRQKGSDLKEQETSKAPRGAVNTHGINEHLEENLPFLKNHPHKGDHCAYGQH